jgi:hypothetical protein
VVGKARSRPAYEDGVERLVAAVEIATQVDRDWEANLSAGLLAGLEFLAADPPLARLLLVDAPADSPLEHERDLVRLGESLRPPADSGREAVSAETLRLLAGGLSSHLSGRVLAGEAERLAEDHDLLYRYLLAPLTTPNG